MKRESKYQLRRFEVDITNEIAKDHENPARLHSSRILYWRVNKLIKDRQSGHVPVKDRNGATISDKERINEKWEEHFENELSRDRVARKDIEENEKVYDTLDMKEDLFCEEKIATEVKELTSNKDPGADSVV